MASETATTPAPPPADTKTTTDEHVNKIKKGLLEKAVSYIKKKLPAPIAKKVKLPGEAKTKETPVAPAPVPVAVESAPAPAPAAAA